MSEALPWTMIGPPSVSFRAATSSRERRIVVGPQLSTRSASVRVVETTYFGMSLYSENSFMSGHTGLKAS